MAGSMRCNICKDYVSVPYFNIPFHHSDVICGCCAMDSTIMGKYAPYTLNNHKRTELFLGWYVNSIFKNHPHLNIDVNMDRVVYRSKKKEYKPDMFMVLTKEGSENVCAINLEVENHKQKSPSYILDKEKAVREHFFLQYPMRRHVCILSLNAMMSSAPNLSGNFEIFYALSYVLDEMFLSCVKVLDMPPEAERRTYSGLALLNYSFGVESRFNFKIAMNRFMFPLLKGLLLDGAVRDDEWFDRENNILDSFPVAIKASESCVFTQFREVSRFLEANAASLNKFVLLSKGTGNLLLVKLRGMTIEQVMALPDDALVEVKEFNAPDKKYTVNKNRVVKGKNAFDLFCNVLYNRSRLLKKLDELEQQNIVQDSDDSEGEVMARMSVQSLSDMEIRLRENMKLVRLSSP